jgi:hypothetical protein
MDITATTLTATSALDRIMALTMERGALWAKASSGQKLTDAERGRLLDIHDLLEALWTQRRQEKAGIEPGSTPDIVVPAQETYRGARSTYRRGRAKRQAGATPPRTHSNRRL